MICRPHFTGPLCGECEPHFTGPLCGECESGWTGAQCAEDIDECLYNPCSEYDLCSNTQGGFTCGVTWGSSNQHKLKLENGHYGNVLVKVSDQPWRGVCHDNFEMNDAKVICKMLGYSSAYSITKESGYGNYDGSNTFALDNVNCSGNEPSLQDCTYLITDENWKSGDDPDSCTNAEYAGVECNRY